MVLPNVGLAIAEETCSIMSFYEKALDAGDQENVAGGLGRRPDRHRTGEWLFLAHFQSDRFE